MDVNAVDPDGDSVLFYAASRGRVDAVAYLLASGADPNPRPGATNETPLTAATQMSVAGPRPPGTTGSNYRDIVMALLRAGADPAEVYDRGYRLMYHDERGIVLIRPEHVNVFLHRSDLGVMRLVNQ